jgi:alkaline phosphatase
MLDFFMVLFPDLQKGYFPIMKKIFSLVFAFGLFSFCSFGQETRSFSLHSHNDYLQKVPFWDAFSAGCASIEVDVILQNGRLMVAHEKESILPNRTLTSLYLKPIQYGTESGLIQEFDFHLLVDFKTEAYSTLEVLLEEVRPFIHLLYSETNPKGLKLIISGNRPKPEDYPKYPSWVFFDYQSQELTTELPWGKIGMVSLSFARFSNWKGEGVIEEVQRQKLVSFIELVHSYDRPVRFWASPDTETAWRVLLELGVDYINTDHPHEAQKHLSAFGKKEN